MSKSLYTAKKWLNPKSTSFIHAEVLANKSWGTLKLADCSRIVDFDIDIGDAKEIRATLKKLNIMIDVITNMRDAIEAKKDGHF